MKSKLTITGALMGLALFWHGTTLAQGFDIPHISWAGVTSGGEWGVFERKPRSTGHELVSTLQEMPSGVAIDRSSGRLYWLDNGLDGSGILWRRGDEGPSEVYRDLGCGMSSATDLVIDSDGGFAYIGINGDCVGTDILKGELSGNHLNYNFLIGSYVEYPQFMGLDRAHQKLYWTSTPPNSGVRRSNLDGTGWETVLDRQTNGIDIDPSGSFLYWATSAFGGPGSIHRFDLQSGVDMLIVETEGDPFDVAIDASGRVFWTERSRGRIRMAAADGSNVQDVLTDVREPTYLSLGAGDVGAGLYPGIGISPGVLSAYPNPFETELVIEMSGAWTTTPPTELLVFDMLGRRVHHAAVSAPPGIVRWDARTNGRALPAGLYAVVLRSARESRSVVVSRR